MKLSLKVDFVLELCCWVFCFASFLGTWLSCHCNFCFLLLASLCLFSLNFYVFFFLNTEIMFVAKFIAGVFRLGKCVFSMSELICSSYVVL